MDKKLQEVMKLPLHNPMRALLVKEITSDDGFSLDTLEREELQNSIDSTDYSDLIVHYKSVLSNKEYKFLVSKLFDKRDKLNDFYYELRNAKQKSLEELIKDCELKKGNPEFWNTYYYLQLYLKVNKYDAKENSELGKRILVVEQEALKAINAEFSGVNVEKLYAFGIYDGSELKAQIASLFNFLVEKPVAEPIFKSTDVSDYAKYRILVDKRSYVGKADVFFMLNEYEKDAKTISCFGNENVNRALAWIREYFKNVSTEDLLISYFDYASRMALNLVAGSKASVAESLVELNKCVAIAEKLHLYEIESKFVQKYIRERCEMIKND